MSSESASLLKRQLQWLLLFRVVVLTLLLGLTMLLKPQERGIILPPLQHIASFIVAVYLFTILSFIALNKTTCYRPFSYIQIFADTFLITFLVYFSGGSRSVFTIIYFFPIIIGGLLLFRTGGLLFATTSTLGYGTILLFEYLGYSSIYAAGKSSPLISFTVFMHQFSVHGLIFFIVALLTIFISERLRQTEAALSQTTHDFDKLQLLYKQIFDDITTGIITVDKNEKITSFNQAASEITGFSPQEVIDKKLVNFFPGLGKYENEPFRQVINLTCKNGTKIPVGYSWTKLNLPDGTDNSRVYTMQDLSQIKKMEEQVRQAEKMAAIGEMAAGVAHEFRNPLAAISGSAQMLGQELDSKPENQKLMNIIIRESDRLEATISEFLQFSKPGTPEKKWFSIKELVDETVQVMQQNPVWDDSCRITQNVPDTMDCWGDPAQIKQILLNLIDNAWTALGIGCKNGEIAIIASEQPADDGKEKTVLTVANNGPPIPDNIMDKIFEPFFTTRENGTGLGLAIVWQIVKSHGGTIKVGNRSEEGTSFILTLPLP
jgi:two-component system sensor histidine kinase PilS (NtrC family)